MKKMKKGLSILLSLVIMVCAMPVSAVTALADDTVRTVDQVSLSTLDGKIAAFETKVNTNSTSDFKPYYNMENGYNKYTYALAVQDAANYGSLNDSQAVSTAASELDNATTNMKVWTAYKANASGKVRYGNVTASGRQPTSYNKILWAYDNTTTDFDRSQGGKCESSAAGITYGGYFWFYYPTNVVLMYDESSSSNNVPKLPIIIGALDKDKNYNIHPRYIYTTSSNMSLSDYWYGYTDNFGWATSNSKRIGYSSSTARGYGDSDHLEVDNESTIRTLSNYLYYKGNPSATLTTISSLSWTEQHDLRIGFGWAGYTSTAEEKTISSSINIRIINYKKLIDQVSSSKTRWITNAKQAVNGSYREGGYAAYLAQLDKVEFDPNSYFSTTTNNYQGCADRIDEAVNALSNPVSPTVDSYQTYYNLLRTAEDQNVGSKGVARDIYAAGNTKWTTSSWAPFKAAMEDVMDAFDAVVNTSAKTYSYNITQSDAQALADALNNAYAGLTERADYTQVDNDSKADSKYTTANAENYTYASFYPFAQARKTVNDYSATADATKLDTAKSAVQTSLDGAHDTLETAFGNLVAVEDADNYNTFDSLVDIVENELTKTDKYTASTISSIQTALDDAKNTVYHEVTSAEAAILGVSAGTLLKNTPVSGVTTDSVTASLLTSLNETTANADSYYSFTVTFKVNKDGNVTTQTINVPFGQTYDFDVSDKVGDTDTVIWETETYNDEGIKTGYNKIIGDSAVSKIINSDATITATITGNTGDKAYTYKIYNGNAKLVNIEYYDTATVKSFPSSESLVAIPLYTFTGWYTSVDESTKTVTVKAVYAAVDSINLTSVNGNFVNYEEEDLGSSANVRYDRNMKIEYTGSSTFYAWAVRVDGKYSVVSYNSEYPFYSQTSLDFVPIIKSGDSYYYETGSGNVAVTASTIASSSNYYFGMSPDEYVKTKLDSKAPFIVIVGKAVVQDTKTRAYVIVTEQASCNVKYTGVGVKYSKDGSDPSANKINPISSVNETGQFSVTLRDTALTNGKFIATVNYDFPYSVHMDVTESSDMA